VNDFVLVTPWAPKALGPGGGEDIAIRFIPQAPGPRQAVLVFVYRRDDGSFDTAVENLGGISDAIRRIAGVGNTTTGGTYVVQTNDAFTIQLVLDNSLISQTSEVYGAEFTLSWQEDLLDNEIFTPPSGAGYIELSKSVDPVTKIESRRYRISNPGIGIGTIVDLGSIQGFVMVAKDTVSPITLSDVTFLDVNMQPTLCYIQTQMISGLLQSRDICGDASLRLFLNGGGIFAVKDVTVGPNRIAVNFRTLLDKELAFEVRNALGAVVKTIPVGTFARGEHSIQIQMNDLPSGMYVVRMTDGLASASERFLLTR
jgi:hypothetical protein